MLYFAYGSNMDWQQMRERCPSAEFVCIAELQKHRLDFPRWSSKRKCGVASVNQDPDEKGSVWGVVYRIDEKDIGALDRNENFDPGRPPLENSYLRQERHVFAEGDEQRPLSVILYIAVPEQKAPPNDEYKRLIVEGARCWHLPATYVRELEEIPTAPSGAGIQE